VLDEQRYRHGRCARDLPDPNAVKLTCGRLGTHPYGFRQTSRPVILPAMPHPLEQLVGEMTLAELAAKSNRSVDQLVSFAMANKVSSGKKAPGAATPARSTAAPKTSRGGAVNTRNRAGREAYEQAVFNVIESSKGKVAATAIRSKVGGTPMQARAALNRLIEDGRVVYEGKARATRYSLA
jgi:hypothetical protein